MTPVARKLLMFCREFNLDVGNSLPLKSLQFSFLPNLNPKEQKEVDGAAAELVAAGYLETRPSAMFGTSGLALTQAGHDYIYGDEFVVNDHGAQPMVQNFNFHGTGHNIQIGNHNTQQIVSAIKMLAEEIEKANVTPEEKAEAKSKLAALLNNPVVSGLLSGIGVEGLKGLGGLIGM